VVRSRPTLRFSEIQVVVEPTTDLLFGVVSAGNGTAFSNGVQVNYFANVTITGGTGRFEGATGTIDVMVYQYCIFDYANIEFFCSSEMILDGQYSVR
jgi:hypothetical protein